MNAESVIRAAGGIVLRGEGDGLEVALVHRPKYDDWSLPKGKLLDGEPEEVAALREVREETGLRCRLRDPAGAVTYVDRKGRPKVVRYWTMTAVAGRFRPTDEVDELRWVSIGEADALLSYPHDRDLLRSVVGTRTGAPLYVVRHAKAGSRHSWPHRDEERPITRRGRRQAARLVDRFEGLELGRVLSSPLLRCVQTIEPLARARGLPVETADELAEGVDVSVAAAFVRRLPDVPTAICGHGREIQALVASFEAAGADVEGRGIAKGSVWVLERHGAGVHSARYLPAPPG
jgi:8-oxo-dGTP diphosphatase